MSIKKLLASITLVAMTTGAQAGLISVDGGDIYTAPNNNNFVSGDDYNIGGNVYATTSVDLTFTYLGHEAGYNNDFFFGTDNLNNKSNSVGDSFSVLNVAAGLLDFRFYANSINSGLANGENNGFGSAQSFAVMLDYTFDGVFYDAVFYWDDSGAGPDDNHDDHIIGLNAVAVPEPATLALMGLGLLCLVLARRRHL